MMDDKVLEDRGNKLWESNLNDLSFLESLTLKSLTYIVYKVKSQNLLVPTSKLNAIIKLLIEAEKRKSDIDEMDSLDIDTYYLELYEEFDKKLNAKIEEILNERGC